MDARHITLRPAHSDDGPAIAAMSHELIETGLGWSWTPQRVARAIAHRDVLSVIAIDQGRLVAFAIMQFSGDAAHLALLAVRSTHQRRGIGRRLLGWLTESCYAAGVATVHLELRVTNHAARRFYRALGFSETAFIPGYYRGRETGLRMMHVLREPNAPLPEWQPPRLDRPAPPAKG